MRSAIAIGDSLSTGTQSWIDHVDSEGADAQSPKSFFSGTAAATWSTVTVDDYSRPSVRADR